MKKRLIVLVIFLLITTVGGYVWYREGLKPVNATSPQTKIFIIKRGENLRDIATRLQRDGLIRDPIVFFIYARTGGIAPNIQAGDFRLATSMDAKTIARTLTVGTLDVWVRTLEGWRNEEIQAELDSALQGRKIDFLSYAEIGYMFPDTYLIPKEASAAAIAKVFRKTFDAKIGSDIVNVSPDGGLTPDQVVVLASLVEREAQNDIDRPIVAGIIMNRYRKKHALQIDATVQYALGYQKNEKSWWKKSLTLEDLAIDSPFNTYKNIGLPPTPICNPGLASLKSALHPAETDYFYYVSDSKGKLHYAKTLEEHNENVKKYVSSP